MFEDTKTISGQIVHTVAKERPLNVTETMHRKISSANVFNSPDNLRVTNHQMSIIVCRILYECCITSLPACTTCCTPKSAEAVVL